MKEHLIHLMKYNQSANKQVVQLLAQLNDLEINKDRKSHFKSLNGILKHITGGALFLQKSIKSSCPGLKGLDHKYMEYEIRADMDNTLGFSQLQALLEVLDSAFIEMVESLNYEDIKKTISFNLPQVKLEYSLGMFIIQYANHGTHHRGQISQILDEMGIENNFSSIAPKYE